MCVQLFQAFVLLECCLFSLIQLLQLPHSFSIGLLQQDFTNIRNGSPICVFVILSSCETHFSARSVNPYSAMRLKALSTLVCKSAQSVLMISISSRQATTQCTQLLGRITARFLLQQEVCYTGTCICARLQSVNAYILQPLESEGKLPINQFIS